MVDDDIAASKAPLAEHLRELRSRLIKSLVAIVVAFVLCYLISDTIFNILLRPYEWAVGGDVRLELIYTAPQEFFFTKVRLAFFGALFLAFPILASQIYLFVAPGLYHKERSAFLPYLIATPVLFIAGACLVYFVIMPLAMQFFLSLQQTGETNHQVTISYLGRVSEYLSLIMTLIIAFGICFQLPVLLTLMARVELVGSDWLAKKRKYAIVLAFIAAAILTPPDPVSQIGLALPTILLYEISIISVRMVEKRRLDRKARAE